MPPQTKLTNTHKTNQN